MWPIALIMAWLLGFLVLKSPPDRRIPKEVKLLVTFLASVILGWFFGLLIIQYIPTLASLALATGQELYYVVYGIIGEGLAVITYALATYLKI